jgi:quinohemoprotein ethanol dehydrogenase
MRKITGVIAIAGLIGTAAFTQQLSAKRGAAPAAIGSGADWNGVNGDSDETGFSRLSQITPANAKTLGLVNTYELPGEASLQASPVAVGGTLYFTGAYASVYAVDGVTGRLKWKFDPKTWQHNPAKMGFGFGANRGVAYANGKIFSTALDGRLFAIDARTGRKLWEAETTDPKGGQTITGAPRVFDGKVIIGQGGADFGMRGYVSAWDQVTGKQVWKFNVVPGSDADNKGDAAMEMAAKTWAAGFLDKNGGGGGPWDSMTFDAEMGRIYVGTANAYEYDPEKRDPGGNTDNLFTSSIVALDARTGKYLWHYQINPRDSWDYDCTQQITLATLTIDGKPRKVLMQAPKNGFFYVIDRESGKVISAEKLGKVNWAERIDLTTGRPVETPIARFMDGPSEIYPSSAGLHSWHRMAFSPATGLVYVPTLQVSTRFDRGVPREQDVHVGGLAIGEGTKQPGDEKGSLVAWDPVAQKARWTVQHDTLWNGGAVATAGGVVFQGAADGFLYAYDARNGAELWKAWAGMGIIAAPMSWSAGGKQYVSVLAGYGGSAGMFDSMKVGWKYAGPRRLLTFTLGGKAVLPESPQRTMQIAALDNPDEVIDPAMAAGGKAMFLACAACHGKGLVSAGGPAPDLRESAIPLDKEAFRAVVMDGLLIDRGMPKISYFDAPKIEMIRQYIRQGQRAAIAAQKQK